MKTIIDSFFRYQITKEEYQLLLDAAAGLCQFCGDFLTTRHLDHCHDCPNQANHIKRGDDAEWGCPECIRGLLCMRCNQKLSGIEEALSNNWVVAVEPKLIEYLARRPIRDHRLRLTV